MDRRNGGKNKGICHSCRHPGHQLWDCPKKQRCRNCSSGFLRWLEVEKKTENIGKLFICCSSDCGFFSWSKVSPDIWILLQDEGQSSGVEDESGSRCMCMGKHNSTPPIDELSSMLERCAGITEQKDIEITLNITMRKGKRDIEDNGEHK